MQPTRAHNHTHELSDTDKIRGAYGDMGTSGLRDPLSDALLAAYKPVGISGMTGKRLFQQYPLRMKPKA